MREDKNSYEQRKNFRWRYQPRNQMDVLLIEYISTSNVRSTTEMMLLALRAFWLPFAIKSASISEDAKQKIITEACCTLLNQLNQIYAISGFSLPNYLVPTNPTDSKQISTQERFSDRDATGSLIPRRGTQSSNTLSIEEQKQAIGQFEYETDSFSNW
ncbi:hypothetical protein NIES4101_61960 [Calothrix sp. NIES-4101]|nr:hypothetical protein NIES4101_61960 [Calothrix sp. NIES-4101]